MLPYPQVDCRWQGKGLGAALAVDVMLRTLQAAAIAGVSAPLVRAKDDTARSFYIHLGFEPFQDMNQSVGSYKNQADNSPYCREFWSLLHCDSLNSWDLSMPDVLLGESA